MSEDISRRKFLSAMTATAVGMGLGAVTGFESTRPSIDTLKNQVSTLKSALSDSQLKLEITQRNLAAAEKLADDQNRRLAQNSTAARMVNEKLQANYSKQLKEAQERIRHLELLARNGLADEWVRTVSPDELIRLLRDIPSIAVSNSFLAQINTENSNTPHLGGNGSGLVMCLFSDNIGIFLSVRHFLYNEGQLPPDTLVNLKHFALFSNPHSPISQHSRAVFVPHPLDDVAVVAFPYSKDPGPMEFINPDMINYNPDWKPSQDEIIKGYSYPAIAYETYVKSVPITLKVTGFTGNPQEVICEETEAPVSSGASGTVMFNSDNQVIAVLSGTFGRKGVTATKIPKNLEAMIDQAHQAYIKSFRET